MTAPSRDRLWRACGFSATSGLDPWRTWGRGLPKVPLPTAGVVVAVGSLKSAEGGKAIEDRSLGVHRAGAGGAAFLPGRWVMRGLWLVGLVHGLQSLPVGADMGQREEAERQKLV